MQLAVTSKKVLIDENERHIPSLVGETLDLWERFIRTKCQMEVPRYLGGRCALQRAMRSMPCQCRCRGPEGRTSMPLGHPDRGRRCLSSPALNSNICHPFRLTEPGTRGRRCLSSHACNPNIWNPLKPSEPGKRNRRLSRLDQNYHSSVGQGHFVREIP